MGGVDGRKDALVLSGGGSRGAYQMGACIGMQDAGFRPELIVGTSVGAINGALLTSGLSNDRLREIWTGLKRNDVALARYDVWRVWKWRNLLRHDPLRNLLEEGVDFDKVRNSSTRFLVTAVDMCCGEVQVWGNEELTIDHLLASAAIPGVFPPVEIDGHVYLDGGVINNTPLRPAVREGADEIFLVLTDAAEPHPLEKPRNVIDVMTRVADIHTHQSMARELVKGEEINALIDQGVKFADWRRIGFHVVAPQEAAAPDLLDFDPDVTARRIAEGEADGRHAFETWEPKPLKHRRAWWKRG